MTDISLPAAAGAGLLSFLSPCVLPLAPPYLCYLAGTSLEALVDEGERRARRDIVIASLLFVAGFSTVFVAFGATRLGRSALCCANGATRCRSSPGSASSSWARIFSASSN